MVEQRERGFGRFSVVPIAEIKTGTAIGLYGAPGVGKTSLAGTVCEYEPFCPVAIIDMEGGSKVLRDKPNIEVIPISTWKDADELRAQFAKTVGTVDYPGWKTLIIDNLSELLTSIIFGKFGTAQLTQPNWGEVQRAMIDFIKFFRDLARDKQINVIFIAWDTEDKSPTGRIKNQMNFIPSLQNAIPGLLDYVGHITVLPTGHRVITFATNPQANVSKFRRDQSPAGQSVPLVIEYDAAHMPLVDIMRCLNEGIMWPVDKYKTLQSAAVKPNTQ